MKKYAVVYSDSDSDYDEIHVFNTRDEALDFMDMEILAKFTAIEAKYNPDELSRMVSVDMFADWYAIYHHEGEGREVTWCIEPAFIH